jgi:type II secretion system protein N
VTLPELPLAQTGLHLDGTLVQGLFSGLLDVAAQKAQPTRLALTGQELRITGLERFGLSGDQLPLGALELSARGRGGRLEIEKLTLRGGELQLDGRGSVLLAPIPANSRLNLAFTLRPGEHFDATLRQLLSALAKPAPDGTLHLRLSGTAGHPQLRPGSPTGG